MDPPPSEINFKLLIVIGIASIIDCGLLIFAFYLVFKVYKLVKFTDMPMLLSIIAITLSLILLLVFCAFDIASLYVPETDWFNRSEGTIITEQIDRLKVMFIYCAFIFDLYKWCVFIAATSKSKITLKQRQKKLTLALICV